MLIRIRSFTASAFGATVCWLIAARFNLTGLTVVCTLWLAASLLRAFIVLTRSQAKFSRLDQVAMVIPLSVYTGWVTVAVFANLSAFLHERGLLVVFLTPVWWAIVMLAAAGAVATVLTVRTGNLGFASAVCWALAGILVANLRERHHPEIVLMCAVLIGVEVLGLALAKGRFTSSFHQKVVR